MTEERLLALFGEYRNMVYRLALSYTHSVQDAEDLVQTVFLKLLESPHPPAEGKEKAWLAKVTVNAGRDLLRSTPKSRWEPLEDTFPAPEEESGLFQTVMSLPPKYRAAVYLHYYEGYTLAETARLLHTGISAVSMRLHRARKLLANWQEPQ